MVNKTVVAFDTFSKYPSKKTQNVHLEVSVGVCWLQSHFKLRDGQI